MTRNRWVNLALVLAVVALFAVPLAVGAGSGGRAPEDTYVGTDTAAVSAIEEADPAYRPWFTPLFTPSSPSVESGLFALQAALGAGALGFVLGRLSGRRPLRPATGPHRPPDAP